VARVRVAAVSHADIIKRYTVQEASYARFAEALGSLLRQLLGEREIQVAEVSARGKTLASLEGKLQRRPQYATLADVPDLCGARIVGLTNDDVDHAADFVRASFDVREEEEHGIVQADTFGYASRHFVVGLGDLSEYLPEYEKFHAEIQVRTVLQHSWALISHALDYKTPEEAPLAVRRQLFRVAALMEVGDQLLGEFGKRVVETRQDYARVVDEIRVNPVEEVAERADTQLPLDIESVRTAWDALPLEEVDRAAKAAEFADWPNPSDELVRSGLSLVLEEGQAAGLRTVGDLERAIRRLPEHADEMHRFAELMVERENHRPVAVPPFVVCVGLALESDAALEVFSKSIYEWMGDALREAKAG
jgi:ppGpp synthetase/RelA/SpoT-type nucleotidyltranferase